MTPEERAESCIDKWQDGDCQPAVLEDVLRDALIAAIAEEREACAKVASRSCNRSACRGGQWCACGEDIAAAIRARP